MSRYEPLRQFLSRVDGDHWKPTFLELERMLGFNLPARAKKARGWWMTAPPSGGGHWGAWTEAGWSVQDVDLDKQTVNFVRNGSAAAANAAPGEAASAHEPGPPLRERLAEQRDRLMAQRDRMLAQRDAVARQAARQW